MQQQQIPQNFQQIFQTISELIVDSKFLLAKSEFFEKNCHLFENEEENKHEYQNIFQDYKNLLDIVMDQRLFEKHDQDSIQQFMEALPQIYRNFENQDCIETLFTFTDFDNFKKTMIDYKKVIDKKTGVNANIQYNYTYDSDQIEKLMNNYYNKDISEWQIVYNSANLKMHVLPYENTGLDFNRTEGILNNTSIEAIKNITVQPPIQEYSKDTKQIHQSMIVEKFEGGTITYQQFQTPLMSQRDMLVRNQIRYINDICLISTHSVELPDFPQQVNNIPRAYILKYMYYIPIGNNQIKYVQIKFQDLKDYIPRMFLNMMMAQFMEQTGAMVESILQDEEKRLKKLRRFQASQQKK